MLVNIGNLFSMELLDTHTVPQFIVQVVVGLISCRMVDSIHVYGLCSCFTLSPTATQEFDLF